MADPTALSTTEAIVIDGANGVTTAPRQHFPDATPFLVLFLVVAIAARFVKNPRLIAAALLLAAIPGAVHVLALRADAPLKRSDSTAPIAAAIHDIQTHAPWPVTPVKVVREDDDWFPLARYALPSRADRPGALELELRGTTGPCREEHVRLVCGAGP